MRFGLTAALLLLSACAGEKLALAPPAGVNFSGQWKLNEADSDDPQRVVMSEDAGAASVANGAAGGQGGPGQGGQGGRGGGRGGRGAAGGAGGLGNNGPRGPVMPAVNTLNDGLRWPGKDLEIKQSGGVVTIASAGINEVYRPAAGPNGAGAPPRREPGREPGQTQGVRDRGPGVQPLCGWDHGTLVVTSENPDDDHPPFEERYSVSEDGRRLFEVVAFKGGRSGGFTVSRVWDRQP